MKLGVNEQIVVNSNLPTETYLNTTNEDTNEHEGLATVQQSDMVLPDRSSTYENQTLNIHENVEITSEGEANEAQVIKPARARSGILDIEAYAKRRRMAAMQR